MLLKNALKTKVFTTALLLTFAFTAGCDNSANQNSDEKPGETIKSEKQRIMDPNVPEDDLELLRQGNTDFAFDLYRQLKDESDAGENMFYSPLSISIALSMTYAGAKDDTKNEMADVLHFDLPEPDLHAAFNALDQALESRGQDAQGSDGEPFRLNVINALWGQVGYPFLESFLDGLALYYGAGMTLLDFGSDPEAARVVINDWVAAQTENRIEDLIPENVITGFTRLVLTNAVYFNASWKEPFVEEITQNGEFSTPAGEVTVPMMRQDTEHGYAEGDGFQAVDLPYDGDELSMVIVVPEEGRMAEIEDALNGAFVTSITDSLETHNVNLTMPKFSFTQSFRLKDTLQSMGMNIPFIGGEADFTGIADPSELYISAVIHKAFLAVDEKGTEAAAATAVVVTDTSAPMDPKVVTLDRPFIFFIRDIETGAVVFVGRVADPTA